MEQQSETQTADTLSAKLESLAGSLRSDVEASATEASEILDSIPGQPQALLLLVAALKVMGVESGASELLQSMGQDFPRLASVHFMLGVLLGRLGKPPESIAHLSRAVALEPNHSAAWRALGDGLARTGDRAGAGQAYTRHTMLSLRELKLVEGSMGGSINEITKAENMLGQSLSINPTDVSAIRMLGETYLWRGLLKEAEATVERALQLAPGCAVTRNLYGIVLTQRMNWTGANAQLAQLLRQEPDNPRFEALMAANLVMLGEQDEALRLFEKARHAAADDVLFWLNFGNTARMLGKDEETIVGAYRKCIELDPGYGAAWWGLADTKTYRFTPAEVAVMRNQLESGNLSDGQRCHIEFALGRALEDEAAYAESFEHYRRANELRRPYVPYDADGMHQNVKLLKAFYTKEFFSRRGSPGCPAPDPIFIVGLPRSGSTLIEQILASHSDVEGTMELPDLGNLVGDIIREHGSAKSYPVFLEDFDDSTLARLGERYLERTRCQRKSGRPFFTDKAGHNFFHIGLIHLILPNAKVVDARRHPLACGFSCYKQAFAPGALHLAYDQTDIGRFYRDYVETLAHFDQVLPGRVHRVVHEELVRDPEREIRRLLAYCDLPFEDRCLRFHETDRSVRTSSSQQVRQPIRKKKTEAWEHYAAWLQPMKDALEDVLTRYPDVPEFG
ncbi:MAG: sulfotransferase [Rhizomicrobium sp.]